MFGDAVSIQDRDFVVLYQNQRAKDIIGDQIGKYCYQAFQRKKTPCHTCPLEESFIVDRDVTRVITAKIRNTLHFFEITASPLKDPEGRIIAGMEVVKDITEQKRMESDLIKSRERFQGLVETTSDWIWEVDRNAVYTYVSPKIHDILGYKPEEILGKTPFDLMPEDEAIKIADMFSSIADSGKSFKDLENVNLHKNGKRIVLETSGVPIFDRKGRLTGYRGIDRDITKRKKSEQKLDRYRERLEELVDERTQRITQINKKLMQSRQDWKGTFDTITDIITIHDSEYNIIGANQTARRLLNLSKSQYSKKIKCFRHYHGTEKPPEGCPSCECLKTGKQAVFEYYEPHLRKFVEVRVIPRKDRQKEVTGLIHVVRDITRRKRAERQLENSREELRRLNAYLQDMREKERARIAFEIHDELGQALTGLKIDVSWLHNKLKMQDKSLRKKIQEIKLLIDSTIQNVRRISYDLRPGVLDDFGLQAAMEWQLEEFQKRTGIDSTIIFGSRLDGLTKELSTTIFRIFQESLTNIARHSAATSTSSRLRVSDGRLHFQIRDNGRGLTKNEKTARNSLGLIGIKERVRYIGGTVRIRGSQGQGTVVSVSVPLKKKSR
jgi:PAS domain S-box-containing protein